MEGQNSKPHEPPCAACSCVTTKSGDEALPSQERATGPLSLAASKGLGPRTSYTLSVLPLKDVLKIKILPEHSLVSGITVFQSGGVRASCPGLTSRTRGWVFSSLGHAVWPDPEVSGPSHPPGFRTRGPPGHVLASPHFAAGGSESKDEPQ